MRKIITFLLSIGMFCTSFISVFAAGFAQPDLFSSFNTMIGYKSTAQDAKLPQGWMTLYNNTTEEENRAKLIDNERIGSTNVLRLNGRSAEFGAAMRYPFSETARTGKIHAGFDMRVSTGGRIRFGGHYAYAGNYNPNDYVGGDGQNWYVNNVYFEVNDGACSTYQPTNLPESGNLQVMDFVTAEMWHRYDLYIDLDERSYTLYVDGEKTGDVYTLAMHELKSFWIQCDTGTAYIDNLYMNHWQDSEQFDGLQIGVDYAESGVALNGGVINLTFSEYVDIRPMPTDFTAVNLDSGVQCTPDETRFSEDAAGYDLVFGQLPPGRYALSVSPEIRGVNSNTSAENKVIFATQSASLDATPRYYLNQDFEGYAGGMPVGWNINTSAYEAGYSDAIASAFSAGVHDGGTALNIITPDAERNIEYKFPSDIYDGKFTIEFDIYHTPTARWAIGLLTPAEYTTELVSMDAQQANSDKDAAWWASDEGIQARKADLDMRRLKTVVFSQWEKTNDEYLRLCRTTNFSEWYNGIVPGAEIPGNVWTHVRAVIDADAAQYRVSINDGQEMVVENVERLRRREMYNVETGQTEYVSGIAGLRLHVNKNTEGVVAFDNVKVYADTEGAHNLYEDYNTLNHPYRPYNNRFSNAGWEYYTTGTEGSSGTAGDKAMRIDFPKSEGTQDLLFWQPLSTPIKAGQSFDVEFDIKNEALTPEKDGYWELILGGRDETTVNGNKNWVIGKRNGANLLAGTGGTDSLPTDTGIPWKTGQWHHIKLSVRNTDGMYQFTLKVDYEDGTQAGTWTGSADGKYAERDTHIFAIRNNWNASTPIYLDNVKITESGKYAADVLGIDAVDYMGAEKTVDTDLSADSQGINIVLSQPLANTDAVSLCYINKGTGAKAIDCTKTLSDDGRTIRIRFKTLPRLNEDIAVEINQRAEFAGSYSTNFSAYQKVFRITDCEGELKVTDFRVYQWFDSRTDAQGHIFAGMWAPYAGESFENIVDGSGLKLIAAGYNTGEPEMLFIAGSAYKTNTDGSVGMQESNTATFEIERGTFKAELTGLPVGAETGKFKGMLWTFPDMRPLWPALEYNH